MRRFKDSKQINNLVIAAAPMATVQAQKFLKGLGGFPPFFWDTKFKSLGLDSTGAPILDPLAKHRIDSAIKAVTEKKGLDEDLAFGASLLTGIPALGLTVVKAVASASPEWQNLSGAIVAATALSAFLAKAKPWARKQLILMYPHVEDTLKNIKEKEYMVSETLGSKVESEPYTLEQILQQLTTSGAKLRGGVWTVPAAKGNRVISRQFQNADDVDKINHMLKHQNLSEWRDALASANVIPASMGITALGYKWWMSIHDGQENARAKAFQAEAPDIRVKQDPTPASKDEITNRMIPVPGSGFQRYTETRELKNGIIEYYVPAFGKWIRKGNK